MEKAALQKLTRLIRYYILTITTKAGSGHPTSSLSAVELLTTLFFKYLRYDLKNPKNSGNDRVIFSKGHASPLYYALYAAAGALTQQDLNGYRTFNSTLEGHPTGRFKYTEAATGSLGQGLSVGLGEALAIKSIYDLGFRIKEQNNLKNLKSSIVNLKSIPRVFVLCGDGELAEGSVWEAAAAASYRKVDNLVLMVDVNRLGQSDPTMYEHNITVYKKRFEAFGWRVVVLEKGNDLDAVDRAFAGTLKGDTLPRRQAGFKGMPTVILAKTIKGKGVSFLENAMGWHGKPLSSDELAKALGELGKVDLKLRGVVGKPTIPYIQKPKSLNTQNSQKVSYDVSKPVATRKAFGNALLRLGTDPRMVVIDGDVKNSSYTEFFASKFPERFLEMFIAEQNMVGVASGLAARGFLPVVSTFACFLTRAADQFRMAANSWATMIVNGTHAGVSIGADGPSQMGLEDISLFRAIHGSTVLYPSDAISCEFLVEQALQQKGITYIRTSRPETPILYKSTDIFIIGGSHVFHPVSVHTEGIRDSYIREVVTVVSAGVTLFEALKAQTQLEAEGIGIRVIDAYSVKPIDQKTLEKAARETKSVIVVEDHYPEGGLGESVMAALASDSGNQHIKIYHLAVRKTPRSGSAAELLEYEEIDANSIIKTVHNVLQ
jgi:transketolase